MCKIKKDWDIQFFQNMRDHLISLSAGRTHTYKNFGVCTVLHLFLEKHCAVEDFEFPSTGTSRDSLYHQYEDYVNDLMQKFTHVNGSMDAYHFYKEEQCNDLWEDGRRRNLCLLVAQEIEKDIQELFQDKKKNQGEKE